jgi:nitrate reductase gamma subunit
MMGAKMEDSVLRFVKFDLQIIALSWLMLAYLVKIYQILRLPRPREVAPQKGSQELGVVYSYASLFLPWAMESTRRHLWRWFEFALYHLGAGAAILATFTIPFAPSVMTRDISLTMAVLVAGAFIMGALKLWRRITSEDLRLVSTPDDYFSLAGVEVFFLFTVMALVTGAPGWMKAYFIATAAFLFYVPFSKISHYVQWFFARASFGLRFGRRGIIVPGRVKP